MSDTKSDSALHRIYMCSFFEETFNGGDRWCMTLGRPVWSYQGWVINFKVQIVECNPLTLRRYCQNRTCDWRIQPTLKFAGSTVASITRRSNPRPRHLLYSRTVPRVVDRTTSRNIAGHVRLLSQLEASGAMTASCDIQSTDARRGRGRRRTVGGFFILSEEGLGVDICQR
jgi:hypothetical protein